MLARPTHAALLVACVACTGPTPTIEPPAQPAEVLTTADIAAPPAPPLAPRHHLDPELARAYRDALRSGDQQTLGKNYPAALLAYSTALTAVHADPRALAGRGHAHLQAGDLEAAAADLQAAEPRASDNKLAAAIHSDLGLLAEQREQPARALELYALADLLRPTPETADKLAGHTPCLATITIGETISPPPRRPTTWREIWTTWFEPSKANLKDPSTPQGDHAARDRVCHYEALDACEGNAPWVLRVPGGLTTAATYADQYILVDLTGTGTLAVAPLVDITPNTTCDDTYDLSIVARDPIVVRTTYTPGALTELCTADDPDCPADCTHGRSTTITTVHTHGTLGRLLTVTTPNRPADNKPAVQLTVDKTTATLTGAGCDRTILLPKKSSSIYSD